MQQIKKHVIGAIAALTLVSPLQAQEQPPIKIGLILPLSGPFADYGKQISSGVRVYMKEHGDIVAKRKVELIIRDDTGVAPELTKRIAMELLSRDKVDMLAGFGLTPSAMAVAPVATQAKKPMVIMNASSAAIPSKSPYIVRVSVTLPQVAGPMAVWAAKNQVQRVFTLVADYAPGIETEVAFKKAFAATGNNITGSLRVPVNNVDFSAYMQKVKDSNANGLFVFLPPGSATISFVKAYHERGLDKAGIKLLGMHDLTDETLIDSLGDGIIDTVTSGYYSSVHDSAKNKKFVADYKKMFGADAKINFMSTNGYDGMAAIYAAINKTGGSTDGAKMMAAFKGMRIESPRGMITIDAETRDIVQTIYMRKVVKTDQGFVNVEFDKTVDVKAPID